MTTLVTATAERCPFPLAPLLSDPVARMACADWLEERGVHKGAALWRTLVPLRLSAWTAANLLGCLLEANRGTRARTPRGQGVDRRLDLPDCLLAAMRAQSDRQEPGCCSVHGGGVCIGWGRGHTTVCLAVRKSDGTVAADVGSAPARTTGGSPATIWPELQPFRPEWTSCRQRLSIWAAQR